MFIGENPSERPRLIYQTCWKSTLCSGDFAGSKNIICHVLLIKNIIFYIGLLNTIQNPLLVNKTVYIANILGIGHVLFEYNYTTIICTPNNTFCEIRGFIQNTSYYTM